MSAEPATDGASSAPPIHAVVKPLSWILGRWLGKAGSCTYPTMKDVKYDEEIVFSHIGQPNIHFVATSCLPDSKRVLHRETGFIRMNPTSNQLAFISAHNNGVAYVEEGTHSDRELSVASSSVQRVIWGKEPSVRKTSRTFRRDGDVMEQVMHLETSEQSLTEHLRVTYQRA
ncbi:PREDICTED: THAP domain-containing protein 4-like [Priapulus caudatus]|uniref:THAP domain-containing protein 4-like n=1 Tax=Priapulus caudatus TaxID=37621 RepID=A0ABM1EPA2_PRICU|nr:PREDICTED: THAP domain-containing protein 4-like [Priapulus caudatus]XP_014674022.1 PREDICTED: THAP domain-containing protein 4-like [Priapulus caudatus]XP_014674023.1 PREDICTED: THAP domain-containing protein 4-like [Priapulus caudatus]